MYKTTRGLVLREVSYRDSSKILTVLTESDGKLTISARGARRKGSKIAAAAQLLAFSEFTLFGRGGAELNEGSSIELFEGLRNDLGRFTLGQYVAQLLETVSDEDNPNIDILRLGLNSLYTLSQGKKVDTLVKAAFELRLMCLAGYAPMLDSCVQCGQKEMPVPMLDAYGGGLICSECATESGRMGIELCLSSLAAMRFITKADNERYFSFTLKEEALKRLSAATEQYVEVQLERSQNTRVL